MKKFLPFFPLNLVAYPTENLNLHIFEPRYRQLINECLEEDKTFGIPAFINNKLMSYGTEMKIIALSKRYPNERLDIKTQGLRIFKINSFENPVEGKLYSGGSIEYMDDTEPADGVIPKLLIQLEKLYAILKTTPEYNSHIAPFSYQVAHKIGISQEEEYELLTINSETERQKFLLRHLDKVIPLMSAMETTKERIKMNGHFKNLDPLKF